MTTDRLFVMLSSGRRLRESVEIAVTPLVVRYVRRRYGCCGCHHYLPLRSRADETVLLDGTWL